MKNIIKKFQENMVAATFAEAGEWETANKMAPETRLTREPTWIDKIFAAVTFAESGLHEEAVNFMKPAKQRNRGFNSVLADELGLKGVRLTYGTVTI